jgi:heptosyltransferase-2
MMDALSPPATLLVRMPNWLGDAMMALPAVAAVRAALPETRIAIAAPSSLAPIFEENTAARQDQVIAIKHRDREADDLRAGAFEAALLLPNSFRSAWVARQAGIPARWGYSVGFRSVLLTLAVRRPAGKLHQSAYYLTLVRELGLPTAADATPSLSVRPETLRRAHELLVRHGLHADDVLVGFAPGAAYGHAKRWPPARVAEVIARVSRERHAVSVLVGAAGDRDAGREIESLLPPDARVVNLIGRTDLRQLAGVLARCRAFVSNDSGAMHLAAAIGVPVAAIFGPTDDRVTAPLGRPGQNAVLIHQVFCRPCMLRDCPIDHRCMKGITVDAVIAAVGERQRNEVPQRGKA